MQFKSPRALLAVLGLSHTMAYIVVPSSLPDGAYFTNLSSTLPTIDASAFIALDPPTFNHALTKRSPPIHDPVTDGKPWDVDKRYNKFGCTRRWIDAKTYENSAYMCMLAAAREGALVIPDYSSYICKAGDIVFALCNYRLNSTLVADTQLSNFDYYLTHQGGCPGPRTNDGKTEISTGWWHLKRHSEQRFTLWRDRVDAAVCCNMKAGHRINCDKKSSIFINGGGG